MANAQAIFGDNEATMTLQEKLDAIDAAMQAAQQQANDKAAQNGQAAALIDPQDFVMCDSCQ